MFQTTGEQTFIRGKKTKSKKSVQLKSGPRTAYLGVDVILLLTLITLLVFGLIILFSASYDFSFIFNDGNPFYIISRQVVFVLIGLVAMGILAIFDYHHLQKLAVPIMGVALAMLMMVLLFGEVRHGSARGLIGGSIQPSEMAKAATVIYLAVWLHARRDQLADINIGLIPLGIIIGLVGGLIAMQPDLSAVITVIFLGGIMFFLVGGDWKQLLLLGFLIVTMGALVAYVYPTGRQRLIEFWNGTVDPLQASDHISSSFQAFVHGGWFGVGLGNAETKLTNLPLAPSDSIFAVVGEETGFIGAAFVVLLYTVLLWRGILVALRAPDDLGSLLAGGITLWIGMEAFVNMAMMLNVLPLAGNALPFMSAGGSNMVVSLAALGILLNVSRQGVEQAEASWRPFRAVVDLGGRYGRGSVPRSSRARRARKQR